MTPEVGHIDNVRLIETYHPRPDGRRIRARKHKIPRRRRQQMRSAAHTLAPGMRWIRY